MDSPPAGGSEPPPFKSWDDLSWTNFNISEDQFVDDLAPIVPRRGFENQARTWGESPASIAWITVQRPVRLQVHARQMIPEEADG